jgi:pimeloyl-ACP methyl ester carboxylesterase
VTAALEEREVVVAGREVSYRTVGQGPPLVLVHGLSGSTRWWTPVLERFAARRTVLLVDLPGFGALARGPRVALAESAGWLLEWMDAAGVDRPALVGHSMGGAIAVRAAAARPGRLDRLVLAAPAGLLARPLLGYGLPLALALARVRPRFGSILVRDALRAGPSTLLRAGLEVAAVDVRADLRRVTTPTLVLVGERDPLVPPAVATVARAELPAARLQTLPRAGHVPMYERPEEFASAVLAFAET